MLFVILIFASFFVLNPALFPRAVRVGIAALLTVGLLVLAFLVWMFAAMGHAFNSMNVPNKSSEQVGYEAAAEFSLIFLAIIWVPMLIGFAIERRTRRRVQDGECETVPRGFPVVIPGVPAEKMPPGLDPDAVPTPKFLDALKKRASQSPSPRNPFDLPDDPAPPFAQRILARRIDCRHGLSF